MNDEHAALIILGILSIRADVIMTHAVAVFCRIVRCHDARVVRSTHYIVGRYIDPELRKFGRRARYQAHPMRIPFEALEIN